MRSLPAWTGRFELKNVPVGTLPVSSARSQGVFKTEEVTLTEKQSKDFEVTVGK